MTIDGNFLEGHCKGFNDGVAAGWEAGYLRAMQDTGAAPVGPVPEPSGIEYISPVHDLTDKLSDLLGEDRISVRAYNCLTREGIHTVSDIVRKTENDLMDIRNLGEKSINEIKALLHGMGLGLKKQSDSNV